MQLTNEKIEVTHQMMEANNMAKFGKYGIPIDPKDPRKGLRWKSISEMQDEDFDMIEEYFFSKQHGK